MTVSASVRSVVKSHNQSSRYFLSFVLIVQVLVFIAFKLWPSPCPASLPSSSVSVVTKQEPQKVLLTPVPVPTECPLGRIFVYSLAPKFNADLVQNCSALNPWINVCPFLANNGLGQRITIVSYGPSWYTSDQFAAEVIFHARMLRHKCRTEDPAEATALYVPFYAGLELGKHLWKNYPAEQRDHTSVEILDWLVKQPAWQRYGGLDHFLVVGRITWDFRRSYGSTTGWGSSFFNMAPTKNITRLLIERSLSDQQEIAIPYPTNFHPGSEGDLRLWQDYLRNVKRTTLFSFAGAPRQRVPNDFRAILLEQCRQAEPSTCRALNCSTPECRGRSRGGIPQAAMRLFLDSSFCLQPRGDSFTRRSIFDCILGGAIPVFFWHRTAYSQYTWHLPKDPSSYSVFIPKTDVRNGTQIQEVLRALPKDRVRQMRETVIQSIPHIIYTAPSMNGHSWSKADAFDIAVDGVLRRMQELNLSRSQIM